MNSSDLVSGFLSIFAVSFRPILPHLLWILPLVIIITLSRTAWFKGWWGELQIRIALRLFLNKRDYFALHNVTLPTADESTTQIDHVVISRFGVFVIETKNYKGWIFGGEHDSHWTQKIHKNHSQRFQSPLRQNYAHTQTLAALLQLPRTAVHGVVVFVGDSTFKTAMPDNVTYCGGLLRYIRAKGEVMLSPEQINAILEQVAAHRLAPTLATHRLHVQNLKQRHAAPVSPATQPTAPAASTTPVIPPTAAPPPLASAQSIPALKPPAAQTLSVVAMMSPPPHSPLATPASPSAILSASASGPVASSCPRCGAPLIQRTARSGANAGKPFWGCSTFPKCRHTQPIATPD